MHAYNERFKMSLDLGLEMKDSVKISNTVTGIGIVHLAKWMEPLPLT